MNKKRYVAYAEEPLVLCSYGNTPAEAFKQMSKMLKEVDAKWFSGATVNVLEDDKDNFAVTVYI
jgi:hypothetical protein